MQMRKIMLVAAALTAGAVGLNGTAAQLALPELVRS
jgi:hypothetical protein